VFLLVNFEVWKPSKEEIQKGFDDGILLPEVEAGLRICPLCCKESVIRPVERRRWRGLMIDFSFLCMECGAKWDVSRHPWTGRVKALRLVNVGSSGRGNELLRSEHSLDFWQEMSLKGLRKLLSSDKQEGLGGV
jgi:hypothetical protein